MGSLRARLKDATKEFKDVLTVRQENLKAHQGRRQLFSALPDRAPGLSSRPGEHPFGATALACSGHPPRAARNAFSP